MKIENGKIKECTEKELYNYWIKQTLDDIFPFEEYKNIVISFGTKVSE